jgi:myo-inositol-1(or 4)-monophosphatase
VNEAGAAASHDLEPLHRAAIEIARQAGEMLEGFFTAPLDVRFKSKKDADPVTQADEAVERFVRDEVARRYPEHGVLGEEGADRSVGSEFLWIVDPLDGTANFANGLRMFAVSIGVLRRGEPVVAALYTTFGPRGMPCIVHAFRGSGLHVDETGWRPQARSLSGRARLAGVPAGFHGAFRFGLLPRMPAGETRSLGSIAVELALVATGELQYALFSSPKIWDVAAGVLLVQEAGGHVFSDRNGTWAPLLRFEPPHGRPLREWKQAIVAGDPHALEPITARMRVRHSPLQIAERLAGPGRSSRARAIWRRGSPLVRAARGAWRSITRTRRGPRS